MRTTTKTSRLLSVIGGALAVIVVSAGIALATQFTFDSVGTVDVEASDDGTVAMTSASFIGEWELVEDDSESDEVELYVSDGTVTKKIEIELEDGVLSESIENVPTTVPTSVPGDDSPTTSMPGSEVETETKLTLSLEDGQKTYTLLDGAVTVTVFVDGDAVTLDWTVDEPWAFVEYEQDGDEAEVEFRDGMRKFEFEAELEDGRLVIEQKFEMEHDGTDDSDDDSVDGPDDSAEGSDDSDDSDDDSDDDSAEVEASAEVEVEVELGLGDDDGSDD